MGAFQTLVSFWGSIDAESEGQAGVAVAIDGRVVWSAPLESEAGRSAAALLSEETLGTAQNGADLSASATDPETGISIAAVVPPDFPGRDTIEADVRATGRALGRALSFCPEG